MGANPADTLPVGAPPPNNLIIAVPKKGRLHDPTLELLRAVGVHFRRTARCDIAHCTDISVTIVFMNVGDIPIFVANGDVDAGIAGRDVVAEAAQMAPVTELLALGFGKCRLCLQVRRESGLQPRDLIGKRVATSFPNITRQYFAALESSYTPCPNRVIGQTSQFDHAAPLDGSVRQGQPSPLVRGCATTTSASPKATPTAVAPTTTSAAGLGPTQDTAAPSIVDSDPEAAPIPAAARVSAHSASAASDMITTNEKARLQPETATTQHANRSTPPLVADPTSQHGAEAAAAGAAARPTTTSSEPGLTKIITVSGSVEAAVHLGLGDAVVDLVDSGETMRLAGLELLAELLHSEAVLISSRVVGARDGNRAQQARLLAQITQRMVDHITASRYQMLTYNVRSTDIAAATAIVPGLRAPTVTNLALEGWVAISVAIQKKDAWGIIENLESLGASDILTFDFRQCRIRPRS